MVCSVSKSLALIQISVRRWLYGMKKTVFIAVLALLMGISAMAACGANEEKKNETSGTAAKETSSASMIIAHNNDSPASEGYSSAAAAKEKEKKKTEIDQCTVTVRNRVYTGKFTEPSVVIKYGSRILLRGKDYTVEYDSTKDLGPGKYSLTVKMCGDFCGTKKYDYCIRPNVTSLSMKGSKVRSITLGWETRESDDFYELEYSRNKDFSDSVTKTFDRGSSDTYCIDGLDENTVIYARIKSCKKLDDGSVIRSPSGSTVTAETKKIENIDGVTYIDGVIIANKTYSLPEDFGDGLDSEALEAFEIMSSDAAEEDLWMEIISGFRSYYTQAVTYQSFCNDRGTEEADRVSARPGHSEHQTGLAMDINSTWFTFADTAEGKWLKQNCWKYGFIIRYPEGKEDITGYQYESWHIRYVGRELAKTLHESGETLEEYFGIDSVYRE